MKHLYLLAFTLLMIGNAAAQKTDLTKDKILIGEVDNSDMRVTVDAKSFLAALNENLSQEYNRLEIKSGYTIGETKELFYYLSLSAIDGTNMVRWLENKAGKLYMENSTEGTHKDYFVACKGVDSCKPNIFVDKKELHWICGDTPGCLTEEEAKRNPCSRTTSIITF